jgi:hypothetical protein
MCQSGPVPVTYTLSTDPDPESETNSQNKILSRVEREMN